MFKNIEMVVGKAGNGRWYMTPDTVQFMEVWQGIDFLQQSTKAVSGILPEQKVTV